MQQIHLEICQHFQDKIHNKYNQQAGKPNDFTLKPTSQIFS